MVKHGMTIRRRLTIGFGILLLLLVGMAGTLLWSLQSVQHDFEYLSEINDYAWGVRRVEGHIYHVLKEISDMVALSEEDPGEFTGHTEDVDRSFDRLETLLAQTIARSAPRTKAHRQAMEQKSRVDALRREYELIVRESRSVIALVQQNRRTDAAHMLEEVVERRFDEQFAQAMHEMIRNEERDVERIRASIMRRHHLMEMLLVAGAGMGLLVGLISAVRTSRSITTRIRRLQEATVRVGQGHLETRIPLASDDEIGRLTNAFDRMVRNVEESTQRLECEIEQRRKAEAQQAETLKQLEQANAELTDFAYVVSHDLKAPLRGIKMLTEWLCTDYRDQLSDEAAENLNLLQSRVKRMHELIAGILQYSRVGRIKEAVVTVDLDALLPDIIDLISPPENIAIEIDGPLPAIQTEKTRIIQVFQNLLSNAVKYMDKPAGRVVVGCSQDDNAWTFSISDNGPGIEQKHFDRIFKIFQTLDKEDDFESTGVGLTLVKKIVEHYGGRVWVVSDVGQGSTFFFTWPKQETLASEATHQTIESQS